LRKGQNKNTIALQMDSNSQIIKLSYYGYYSATVMSINYIAHTYIEEHNA